MRGERSCGAPELSAAMREMREPALDFGQSQASARAALGGTPLTGYTTRNADDTGRVRRRLGVSQAQ
jgi:hypothetical protein